MCHPPTPDRLEFSDPAEIDEIAEDSVFAGLSEALEEERELDHELAYS
jgi:hypothetical protein